MSYEKHLEDEREKLREENKRLYVALADLHEAIAGDESDLEEAMRNAEALLK